jgi:putative phosphoribosyl transferase
VLSWIRRRSRWTSAVCGCLGRWSSRNRPWGWSSSPTAAAAAGAAPRNQFVAAALNRVGLGTFLVDLLTADEELSRVYVFNIARLATRLAGITCWLRSQPATATIPVGYFGASTGAAAALQAAAANPRLPVRAIVSRGGRPDLVGRRLCWPKPATR